MEFIVPAIIILIVIIRTFMSAAKSSRNRRPSSVNPPPITNRQSTGSAHRQSSGSRQSSSNRSGNIFSPFLEDIKQTVQDQMHETMRTSSIRTSSGQRTASAKPKSKSRSSSPPPLPANRPVAYSQPIEADHFSETELVNKYRRAHSQGKTLKHHTHKYFDPEKDGSKSRAGEAKKKRAVMRKQLLKSSNIRRAIIMKEILDRPDF